MAKKITTYSQLKIRKAGSNEQPLNITLIDPDLAWEIIKAARAEGFEIVDQTPGYKLYRDVEEAMRDIRVFCRR